MDRLLILVVFTTIFAGVHAENSETILSTVLTPDSKEKTLSRQGRSYYDYRYGARPLYDRLEYARYDYDRPAKCGRCYDDRYDDDYDRSRDRYDDDRRVSHRPTYGNRYDNKKNYDSDDDDRRFNSDRKNKNGTEDENDSDKKRPYDDKDNRPSGSRRGDRDRKPDDRDRYRPDYYDRFLGNPQRDRRPERPYYDDDYRERRPLFDRYPYPDRYDEGYGGRYDGYGYPGYRRPIYDDRYDRGNGYDDAYGGYGPGVGRGPHDSFRPWDETYRGQAGWDAGGRGYYFASGRPDAAPASAWGRPEYARPESTSGWQNVGYPAGYGGGYASGYRDPLEYRGSFGYGQDAGYRQDLSAAYGQVSGWHNVGERRPYRDQSGVNKLDKDYNQRNTDRYGQSGNREQSSYGQSGTYGQSSTYGQSGNYGQSGKYGQSGNYGQSGTYGQPNNYGQSNYGQPSTYQSTGSSAYTSSTTPQTSYLYQREDEKVTPKPDNVSTKAPS